MPQVCLVEVKRGGRVVVVTVFEVYSPQAFCVSTLNTYSLSPTNPVTVALFYLVVSTIKPFLYTENLSPGFYACQVKVTEFSVLSPTFKLVIGSGF